MVHKLEEIKKQAEYCLNCKMKPCKSGCPLQNNIPDFIEKIKEEKFEQAFEILSETTVFEPICGRICPQKKQCERACIRGLKGESVEIGALEKFIGDYALKNLNIKNKISKTNGKKVAIIGSGPAGLAGAHYLSNKGYQVTIFEKHSKLGGLLRNGIPEFRLEKKILDNWLDKYILNDNIQVVTNKKLGTDIYLEDLKREFDAILLATGANVSRKMYIPGEEKDFVFGGNELLEYRTFPDFKDKTVAIIGGGNVAIDCARTVKKLGAKSSDILYRRNWEQMPAEKKEIEDAKKEGVKFLLQTNILQIEENVGVAPLGDPFKNTNKKHKLHCIHTELVKKEGEKRAHPENELGTDFTMYVDYVIMAIGSQTNKNEIENLNIKTTERGYIETNEDYKTSDNQVFAAGDLIGNKQTVAWAARSGYDAAKSIDGFLSKNMEG